MGTGVEAVGDAVAGGVLAHAVEPVHGEVARPASGTCLNCGTALAGAFCHACGQRGHVHRTLGAFMHDLLHGVFHFEGKVWRTLPDLILRPGMLTRDYIEGKRARYVSPLALFLFMVFLMFAVLGWTSSIPSDMPIKASDAKATLAKIDQEIARLNKALALARSEREQAARAGGAMEGIDARIDQIETDLESARTGRSVVSGAAGTFDAGSLNIQTRSAWLDQRLREAAADPKFVIYKMKSSAYKFAWAIIPLSVPFVALLFLNRRRYGLYDHAVFVTYSLCAMSLLLVVGSLVGVLGLDTAWLVLLVPLHFFFQLRGTYALSVGGALWRTGALMAIAMAVMVLFAVLLLALGVF